MFISVIIPCYNAERFVHRAIESIINQTYTNWEMILVDNNSIDGTVGVLQRFQSMFPDKIKVFIETKKGGCAVRNKGLYEASGDWIQFLDADDEVLPDKLTRQAALAQNTKADLIVGNFSRVVRVKCFAIKVTKKPLESNIWHGLISAKLGITSANLWRRTAVLAVNGWDESLSSSQEYNLIFRMLKNGSTIVFDIKYISALIYYEGNSVTRNGNKEKNIQISNNYITLRLQIKKYLKSKNLLDDTIRRLIDLYMYSYLYDKRSQIPEYVSSKFDEFSFDIPLASKLKQRLKYLTKIMIAKLSG